MASSAMPMTIHRSAFPSRSPFSGLLSFNLFSPNPSTSSTQTRRPTTTHAASRRQRPISHPLWLIFLLLLTAAFLSPNYLPLATIPLFISASSSFILFLYLTSRSTFNLRPSPHPRPTTNINPSTTTNQLHKKWTLLKDVAFREFMLVLMQPNPMVLVVMWPGWVFFAGVWGVWWVFS